MIGRLQLLLPAPLYIAASEPLPSVEVEYGGFRAVVHPPYQCDADVSALSLESPAFVNSIVEGLGRCAEPRISPGAAIGGQPAIAADALEIDFRLPDEFERTSENARRLIDLGTELANGALARIRTLARSPQLGQVGTDLGPFRWMFLRDDETAFDPAPPLIRTRAGSTFPLTATGLPRVAWDAAWSLPEDFEPQPWDTLWLDAAGLLPDIGPALVLAYSALEARISNALDVLVEVTGFDAALWTWVSERGGDFAKQPSMKDRFGPLLKALGGKSLKEEATLWEAFSNLGEARNRFAHDGKATIGGRPVSVEKATELVRRAAVILGWIESLLPEEERRPALHVPEDQRLDVTKQVLPPRPERIQAQVGFRTAQPHPLESSE